MHVCTAEQLPAGQHQQADNTSAPQPACITDVTHDHCPQDCVTRRKPQTPGTAKEDKRQGTPTINTNDRHSARLTDQAPGAIERAAQEDCVVQSTRRNEAPPPHPPPPLATSEGTVAAACARSMHGCARSMHGSCVHLWKCMDVHGARMCGGGRRRARGVDVWGCANDGEGTPQRLVGCYELTKTLNQNGLRAGSARSRGGGGGSKGQSGRPARDGNQVIVTQGVYLQCEVFSCKQCRHLNT